MSPPRRTSGSPPMCARCRPFGAARRGRRALPWARGRGRRHVCVRGRGRRPRRPAYTRAFPMAFALARRPTARRAKYPRRPRRVASERGRRRTAGHRRKGVAVQRPAPRAARVLRAPGLFGRPAPGPFGRPAPWRPHQVSGIAYVPNILHKCDRFDLSSRTNGKSKCSETRPMDAGRRQIESVALCVWQCHLRNVSTLSNRTPRRFFFFRSALQLAGGKC